MGMARRPLGRGSVGVRLNLGMVPALLAPRYNGRVAPGFGAFVNLWPAG